MQRRSDMASRLSEELDEARGRDFDARGMIARHGSKPEIPADVKKRHKQTALQVKKLILEAQKKAHEALSILESQDKASKVLDPKKANKLAIAASDLGSLAGYAGISASLYER